MHQLTLVVAIIVLAIAVLADRTEDDLDVGEYNDNSIIVNGNVHPHPSFSGIQAIRVASHAPPSRAFVR